MPEVMLNRLNNQPLALAEVQIFRLEPNWRGWRAKSRFSEPSNTSPGCAWPSALNGSATLHQELKDATRGDVTVKRYRSRQRLL
jgi:hypothetical protein